MRVLGTLGSVFFSLFVIQTITPTASAAASIPLSHNHAGRIHSHPLPATGFAHRHGNGAPGIMSSSPGRITGTLTPNTRPPTPIGTTTDTITGTITGTVAPNSHAPKIHSTTLPTTQPNPQIQPPPTLTPPLSASKRYDKADTRCQRNAADCNVCAANVKQQFAQAAARNINWQKDSWRFNWNQSYPPEKIKPTGIFAGQQKYLLGIPAKHIQGFVRTNSEHYLFAGSHSHRNKGGIFLLRQNPQGNKYMAALFKTNTRHPSGVHILGQYLAYGEQGHLYLKDLQRPSAKDTNLPLPGPQANFGGGLGLVRLPDGSHLMVTTGPGGQDQRPRTNRFYHLSNRNGRPNRLRFINQSAQVQAPNWAAGFRYAENLSLITECGSGDIYAVHTSGDQNGINALTGNGYWRLSKVVQQNRQLRLQPMNAFTNRQNMSRCSMRATATVHVNRNKRLEFYCHGYAKDPKGSVMNVLGKSKNKFNFTVGRLR